MDIEWFHSIVDRWDLELDKGGPWRKTLAEKVRRIAELNGGQLFIDTDISLSEQKEHALLRAEEALQHRAGYYASLLRDPENDRLFYWSKLDDVDPGFGSAATLRPKIDINTASKDVLVDLPNIGSVTAQRIIKWRATKGAFTTIAQLSDIKGLPSKAVDEIKHMITAKPITFDAKYYNNALKAFSQSPSFAGYIDLMRETNGYFRHEIAPPDGSDLTTLVEYELDHLIAELMIEPYHDFRNQYAMSAARALEDREYLLQYQKFVQNSIEVKYGSILFDSSYHKVVHALICAAKKSVRLSMFFFRFEGVSSYPTDNLMAALVQAKERGLDIKVILDQNDANPASTTINSEALAFLTSKGIDTKFDHQDVQNHVKLLIIDDEYAVIGSHNWTAGSFYVYDDTSILLQSDTLSKMITDDFDRQFRQL